MLGPIAAACLSWMGFAASACAEDWRRGEFEYMRKPHHVGRFCAYGFRAWLGARRTVWWGLRSAQGRGGVDPRLGIGDWEFEASRLFGPRNASCDLAMSKKLHCDVRGLEFVCAASASVPAAVI